MSHTSQPPSPRPRVRFPMWTRWALSLGVGVILLVALVLFVSNHNSDNLATQSPKALARANREAEIVVAQDQAPHVFRLASSADPHAAIVGVVRADIKRRINLGVIDGSLQRVVCRAAGGPATRPGFSCTATVSDVNYQFLGVVDRPAGKLTYCKRDAPPVPSQNIPISPRCRA